MGSADNVAKLSRLLVNIGAPVLRHVFDSIHRPSTLQGVLQSPAVHGLLNEWKQRKLITYDQWNCLYPKVKRALSSNSFDIILLNLLIKNICSLTPPDTGWDVLPLDTADTSREADLARINFFRNHLAIKANLCITDTEFEQSWNNIKNVLVRLGGSSADIQSLKVEEIDSDEIEYYHDFLVKWESREKRFMQAKEGREQTNFTRLSRLLINIGTQVLRDVFDSIHPPSSLHGVLNNPTVHYLLKQLKNRKVINKPQWDKLYPTVRGSVTSGSFDITLLFVLLRNICGLVAPPTSTVSTGSWDALPAPTDTSREADLVRIKYFRNTIYGHITKTATTDVDFEQLWSDIAGALLRLGGTCYRETILSLKVDAIDPDEEKYCNDLLVEWEIADKRIMNGINIIMEQNKELKELLTLLVKGVAGSKSVFRSEDVDIYTKKMKRSIIDQTEKLPNYNSLLMGKMKTDEIFTNILIRQTGNPLKEKRPSRRHDGKKTAPVQIQKSAEMFANKDQEGQNPKRMIISGQPGIGKTLFSHKLIRDWAKDELFQDDTDPNHPDLKFTFLLTFRQLNEIKNNINLSELLNLSTSLDTRSMTDDSMIEYFEQHPEQIFIVIDGFDEFKHGDEIGSNLETQFPNDARVKMPVAALCSKLIQRKLLNHSIIMITSRPEKALRVMHRITFDRYLEITGFNEQEVEEYIKKYFKDSENNKEKALKMLEKDIKEHRVLLSFAQIPILCFFVCYYMEWNIDEPSEGFPITLTEFYSKVIQHIEEKHNKLLVTAQRTEITAQDCLAKLSVLAAKLVEDEKYSGFDEAYLVEKLKMTEDQIAYVKASNLLSCIPGVKGSPFDEIRYEYNFIHLTVQEFLAARRFVEKREVPTQIDVSDMILQFSAGLAGDANNENIMFKLLEYIDAQPKLSLSQKQVTSIKLLYEYSDEEMFKKAVLNYPNKSLFWSDYTVDMRDLSVLDVRGLALLINTLAALNDTENGRPFELPEEVAIQSSSLTSFGIEKLSESLSNPFCPINKLSLDACELTEDSVVCLSNYLLETQITELSIINSGITAEGAQAIARHAEDLSFLDLSDNDIYDKGVGEIARRCRNIKSLNVDTTRITNASALAIAEHCKGIVTLNLENNDLTDEVVIAIVQNCKHIEDLNLRSNQLRDASAKAIAEHCNHLNILDLSNNYITDEGALAIAQNLHHQLERVDLRRNQISDECKAEVRRCLEFSACMSSDSDDSFDEWPFNNKYY